MQQIYKEGPEFAVRPVLQQLKCKSQRFDNIKTKIMIWQKLN